MAQAERVFDRDRLKATLGAAAFHVLAGYALLYGLGFDVPTSARETLKVFSIAIDPPPPPAPVPPPAPKPSPEPEGAAAPPGLPPSPVVAPKPKVELKVPPPVVAAPEPAEGKDTDPGNSDVPGAGTGTGGEGTGTGSGGQGTGTGGGGVASSARRVAGGIGYSDYPRAARRSGAEGVVYVRFTVGTDGRARGCTVSRSSGHSELDAITCTLIERRFRYIPAKNARGDPVPDVVNTLFEWNPGYSR